MFKQANSIVKIAQCVQLSLSHPSLLVNTDSHGGYKTLGSMARAVFNDFADEFCKSILISSPFSVFMAQMILYKC